MGEGEIEKAYHVRNKEYNGKGGHGSVLRVAERAFHIGQIGDVTPVQID